MLAELEAAGDAMRYVNFRGELAWKATPQLRSYLMDLLLDGEGDDTVNNEQYAKAWR